MRDRNKPAVHSDVGFWERLREHAIVILDHDIADLRKKIIDPDHCLSSRDRLTMKVRQEELAGILRVRRTLDGDGPRAKMAALGVVLESKPELLKRSAG